MAIVRGPSVNSQTTATDRAGSAPLVDSLRKDDRVIQALKRFFQKTSDGEGHIEYKREYGSLIAFLQRDKEANSARYEDSLNIGAAVRVTREERGLDRSKLAKRSTVNPYYLELLEHGNIPTEEISRLPHRRLGRIATVLNTTIEELETLGKRLIFQATCGGVVRDPERIRKNLVGISDAKTSKKIRKTR